MEFNDQAVERIFGEELPGLYLFTSDNTESAAALETFRSVGADLKSQIILSYAEFGTPIGEALAEYVGITAEECPTFRIVVPNPEVKYRFTDDITAENLKKFVADWNEGKLEPFVRSEPIPESNDGPVKIVVAKTFNEIVIDSDADVLIEFYAPWCAHCQALAPIYEELGTKLAGVRNLVIAKMDATANDLDVGIESFPTVMFFKRGFKQEPYEYEGERTVEGFMEFLKGASDANLSGEPRVTDQDL